MSIEHADAHVVPKPWGVLNLYPWSAQITNGEPVGEIWFERSDKTAIKTSLLLKLLFTNEPLSIQVHPDDVYAHSVGLPNGKTEAWHILSALPGAKVALGSFRKLGPRELRAAIDTGSISDEVPWRSVTSGDTILVPAGTIHAIGAGLVIAEIQQRSDETFRLFDYGRQRTLHAESAVAVAHTGPIELLTLPIQMTAQRTLLVDDARFALERIELQPNSVMMLDAERETWLLVLNGDVCTGSLSIMMGEAIFAQYEQISLKAGARGATVLMARTGSVISQKEKRTESIQ